MRRPISELKGENVAGICNINMFQTLSYLRLYSGVDWSAIIPQSASPPPTTVELQPDMVSFRFTSKRYAPKAEIWQVLKIMN